MLPIHHPAKNDLHIDAEEKMREREGERARGAGWGGTGEKRLEGGWGGRTYLKYITSSNLTKGCFFIIIIFSYLI